MYLCRMNESVLYNLVRLVLPSEVLDYFDVTGVGSGDTEMHIHLDEKMNEELHADVNFESKGFTSPTSITDFPIRDHKVILEVRLRRWLDLRTGKSFSLPMIPADETCHGRYPLLQGVCGFFKRDVWTHPR